MACREIEPGMPVARVKRIMSYQAELPPDAESEDITFIVDHEHPADWCRVHVSGHAVRDVDVSDW
jgi:hypothetical protein